MANWQGPINVLRPHIRVFHESAGIDKERARKSKENEKNSFLRSHRDLAIVYSRENVRVTRAVCRPHRFVSFCGIPVLAAIKPRVYPSVCAKSRIRGCLNEVAELSSIPVRRDARYVRDMTRTKNATENDGGGGGGVVVGPAKKTLIRVGKYQMLGPLGKGNFARVEEAIHTVLGVKVSVINSNRRRERAAAPSPV